MQLRHHLILSGSAAGMLAAAPAGAQTIDLSITLPHLPVSEYHRPYVAVWLEGPGMTPKTLAVWYELKKRNDEGRKWLSEVRQWWRVSGRSQEFLADGVSGATRAPGVQSLSFTAGKGPLAPLKPGDYTLVVEAAREVGGRESVRLPFSWPPKPGPVKAAGTSELGAVSATIRR